MATQAELISAIERARAAGDTKAVSYFIGELSKGRPAEEVRSEYDEAPFYQKIPQAALDVARLGTSGAALGNLDEASGLLSSVFGGDYETERAIEEARINESRARSGSAGQVAEFGGSVLPTSKIYGVLRGPIGKAAKAAKDIPYLGKAGKIIADKVGGVLAGGATGGTVGGLQAFGTGEDVAEGIAGGALVGKLAGATGPLAPVAIPAGLEALKYMADSDREKNKKRKKGVLSQ